jgi:hypothetical protein
MTQDEAYKIVNNQLAVVRPQLAVDKEDRRPGDAFRADLDHQLELERFDDESPSQVNRDKETPINTCQGAGVEKIDDTGRYLCGNELPTNPVTTSFEAAILPDVKESNPKDIVGSDKVPLGLVPGITMGYLAVAHLEGDLKYGRTNWREAGVRTSIYIDACLRHLEKFKEGQWEDTTTKVPHLASAMACMSIIVDAYHAGKLVDDRPKSVDASSVIDGLGDVVKHLKSLHGHMKPIDYFIDGPKQRS